MTHHQLIEPRTGNPSATVICNPNQSWASYEQLINTSRHRQTQESLGWEWSKSLRSTNQSFEGSEPEETVSIKPQATTKSGKKIDQVGEPRVKRLKQLKLRPQTPQVWNRSLRWRPWLLWITGVSSSYYALCLLFLCSVVDKREARSSKPKLSNRPHTERHFLVLSLPRVESKLKRHSNPWIFPLTLESRSVERQVLLVHNRSAAWKLLMEKVVCQSLRKKLPWQSKVTLPSHTWTATMALYL